MKGKTFDEQLAAIYEDLKAEKPVREKLTRLFRLGRQVGEKEYTSAAKHPHSCGSNQLKNVAKEEFEEAHALIEELVRIIMEAKKQ